MNRAELHSPSGALLKEINRLRSLKALDAVEFPGREANLRRDLDLDSLDLAELTVRLEKEFGVDVFGQGLVHTVGEVLDRLNRAS